MNILNLLAKRYIAGEDKLQAIEVVRRLNGAGISGIIDVLGENVRDPEEARANTEEYLSLLDLIREAGVDSSISLKLTHLGLDISEEVARRNVEEIAAKAGDLGNSVRIDMEGSAYTRKTLEIFLRLLERYPNVGIAIQSYLRRSEADVKLLIEKGASVRLVKGAYKEPEDVAFPEKKDVDRNFSVLMKELLLRGKRPAIATHDEKLIAEAKEFARAKGVPKDGFDFEMLLGIKRSLQRKLIEEGYCVRVYIPYGPNWLPYTIRRLTERKENLFFVLKNIFD